MLEYVSQAAIADIRRQAAPAALGSAVLSRGVEEHAGFSTQSARATTDVVRAYRIVLACELVAAVRALRLSGVRPDAAPLAEAFDQAAGCCPPTPPTGRSMTISPWASGSCPGWPRWPRRTIWQIPCDMKSVPAR